MVAGYHEQYAFFDLKPVKLFEKWFNKSRPQKTNNKNTTTLCNKFGSHSNLLYCFVF